ncbi:MAG: cellulase family glycosylhydrolase [Abyssibacter sp.]|uniref:glycoside hydrolase family 5 protein n=1 Tax=Abyssibacter sp. TaxID=2320200 RepID=UPI00321A553E
MLSARLCRLFRPSCSLLVALVCATWLSSCGRVSSGQAPSPALVEALGQGVNLSHWWTGPEPNAVLGSPYVLSEGELARVREQGFRHVRLPVDPARLFESDQSAVLRQDAMARLRADLEAMLAADLAVVLAVQMDSAAKQRLFASGGQAAQFGAQWAQLAGNLADFSPDRLVLEILNEPEIDNPWAWAPMQRELLATIRREAPRLSILVSGAHYSDPVDLAMLAPLPDRNVIYGFHFYTPHNFTHQGADWGWEMWQRMRGLPYPSSLESVESAVKRADPGARPHVEHYGRQQWTRDKLAAQIELVEQWAGQYGLVVQCTEFGVIRQAPEADRVRWLRDARGLMERAGFGWTVWDLTGAFAIADRDQGQLTFDPAMLDALATR